MDPHQHSFVFIYSIYGQKKKHPSKRARSCIYGVNSAAGAMGLNLFQHRSDNLKCGKGGSRCRKAENGDWNERPGGGGCFVVRDTVYGSIGLCCVKIVSSLCYTHAFLSSRQKFFIMFQRFLFKMSLE